MTAGLEVNITVGPITAVPATTAFADNEVIGGPCLFFGWSFRESTGANPAQYEIRSGSAPLAEIVIAAGGANSQWLGAAGIWCPGGITVHPVGGETGSVSGVIYAGYADQ